jgi:two-component system, OmpR family, sensor histidine kinase SenX3
MTVPGASKFEQLLEVLPDPALVFDHQRRLTATNSASRQLFDLRDEPYTPSQVLGTAHVADLVEEAAAGHRTVRMGITLDGRDLEVTAAPLGDSVVMLVRDQSARSRVDAIRRDFVTNASHETKTPVSGIQSLADALIVTLDRHDHARSRELAERLGDEAARLGRLVTELLSLRRLEDNDEQTRAPVDLVTVVTEELDRIAERAKRRHIAVTSTLPATAVVAGSEPDLRLMVSNLLDNAVGYNRDGGELDVVLRSVDGAWQLEVTDRGIGIPRQDLDRIFERFYRVDVARSRASGGTGLGLAIVRHAVEGHGGSVRVHSILGEGTTFTVELPVR